MKTKFLLTTAIVTCLSAATAGIVFAQGDQNRYAENNPNETLPPVQNQNVNSDFTVGSTATPINQYQYQNSQLQNQNRDIGTKEEPAAASKNQSQYQNPQVTQEQKAGEENKNQLRVNENRTDPAGVHAYRLQFRFDNYSEKLWAIANRIQAFIDRFAGQGKNVDQAQENLNQARQQLGQAQMLGDRSVTAFIAIDPAMYQAQRQLAVGASEVAQKTQEAYQNALQFMLQAVRELRQAE